MSLQTALAILVNDQDTNSYRRKAADYQGGCNFEGRQGAVLRQDTGEDPPYWAALRHQYVSGVFRRAGDSCSKL